MKPKQPKCPTCGGALIVFVTDDQIFWCKVCRNTKRLKPAKVAPQLTQRSLFSVIS